MMFRFRFLLLLVLLLSSVSHSTILVDSLVYSQAFVDTTKYDRSLTSDIDLKSAPGKIILALGATKNLSPNARFTSVYLGSYPPSNQDPDIPDTAQLNGMYLGDNNFSTINVFPTAPISNIGSYIKVDLRSVRSVNKVVLINNLDFVAFYRTRPIAFSLFTGLDSNSLSRVYQEVDNVDTSVSRYTINIADVRPIRYLRFAIDRMNHPNATILSEMQIFGDGYVPEGAYVSKVDSFVTGAVNFASVFAEVELPVGTSLSMQMRTGSTGVVDDIHWSDWSEPILFSTREEALAGKRLNVSEPRKYFQYKVNLYSLNLETPKVDSIYFTYQHSLVADSVFASIAPNEIPAFEKTTLHYNVNASFSTSSLGIDTLIIYLPSPSTLQNVLVNGTPVAYNIVTRPDKLTIGFPNSIATSSTVEAIFSTRLISSATFKSEIISKTSPWNPQSVETRKNSFGEEWFVNTTGISNTTLVNVKVDPNPFTPNGDGKNDQTIVDFAVANLEKMKTLRIFIYNLLGKKIRTLAEISTGISPFYGDPRTGGKGILWDGKDDNGAVVSPGVYLMRIAVDTDNGGEYLTKTVVVSY